MKYQVDHDYHIHSQLSSCSRDKKQTKDAILQYARDNGFGRICVTDHYWDSAVAGPTEWYRPQDYAHISRSLPLPQDRDVECFFGCETELRKDLVLGIPPKRYDDFSFIIIPTTHLDKPGFTIDESEGTPEARARVWVARLEGLLHMDLPFHKIGIAHLACKAIFPKSRESYIRTLDLIPNEDMVRVFTRAAELRCGIELNQKDMSFTDDEADTVLRMFRVAKDCGCKFYLGSDSHHPEGFVHTKEIFERAIRLLDLQESDKFYF